MDPTLVGILSIVGMLVFLVIGLPVAFAMGLAGFLGFVYLSGTNTAFGVLYNLPYRTISSWLFSVIPMFILMGDFAFYSGITSELFSAARKWLGRIPGGLAVATIAAAAGFAATTGAAMASAAAMTRIAVPEMEKAGYQRKMALGTVAIGGTLAGIIPPSVGLVIFGILTETSIARLLIGGILPGILIAALLMLFTMLRVMRNPALAPMVQENIALREKLNSLKGVWGALVLFLFVMGALYTGITTPTEAAAVGAFGALVIALAKRNLNRGNFKEALFDTGRTTAMIMFIFVGGMIFSRFLTFTNLPQQFVALIENVGMHPAVFIVAITVMYVILGMFIDQTSMTLITIPIIFPVVV
ncbi:MAG TPA: TRAP transporter large permease subunit, partial [Dehalococcoidales bacterium]|nr:TRAP transporter large permease subunit [Dehalococcoidales bacterium]